MKINESYAASLAALCLTMVAQVASAPEAHADQIWLGLYEHDVTIAQSEFETGQDVKIGWIGPPIEGLRAIGAPSPHLLASKSLQGQTDYFAAGLSWTFGSTIYLRPGIGLAVHNGPSRAYRNGQRVDLGSPVLFEPELAAGWRIDRRFAVEASWIHLSHATLFSKQNRGMDSMGLRLLVTLP